MLRKKLLLILGSLVSLLVVATIAAILLLQGVVYDLEQSTGNHSALEDQISAVDTAITQVEIELRHLHSKTSRHLDDIINKMDRLREQCALLARNYPFPEGRDAAARLEQTLERLEQHIGALATTEDPDLAAADMEKSLLAVVEVRGDILELGRHLHDHVARQGDAVTSRFRFLVQGLAILFLALINISALVLLHVAAMILRPVDQLLHASRELAQEHFDYRVEIAQKDEFQELGRAYNHMASQLQSSEQRRLEILAQVAVALNHELNNAGAIIELQLTLLGRQAGGNAAFETCLRQIHESLARMTGALESLKRVRRIVLTDYGVGMKMLDLQRSVEEDGPTEAMTK